MKIIRENIYPGIILWIKMDFCIFKSYLPLLCLQYLWCGRVGDSVEGHASVLAMTLFQRMVATPSFQKGPTVTCESLHLLWFDELYPINKSFTKLKLVLFLFLNNRTARTPGVSGFIYFKTVHIFSLLLKLLFFCMKIDLKWFWYDLHRKKENITWNFIQRKYMTTTNFNTVYE